MTGLARLHSLLLACVLSLVLADLALAQAGSGSGGFGGGGGGGGGGSGGGFGGSGGRSGGEGDGGGFSWLVIVAIFLLFVVPGIVGGILRSRRIKKRRTRVHTASAEAATDDAYLAAEAVERDAAALYAATQVAWDRRDREALAGLVGEELMVEWNRRLDDFDRKGWHNRVAVKEPLNVRYVALENRDDDAEDRVVVLIEGRLEAYVEDRNGDRVMRDDESDEHVSLEEYWTLARHRGGWMVVSIEQAKEGDHHLGSKIVALPEADTERIRGDAVTELATADGVPEGFTTADLATLDFEGTARQHALDLSVADGRFAPDVLEVAARRAVAAWAEAVDGSDSELEAVSSPEAARGLLHGTDASGRTRMVVRGPGVRHIHIAAVDVDTLPARMEVDIELSAVRYVEDRDTTDVLSGSRDSAGRFTERWTLALEGPDEAPWRLVETTSGR
jgi:predicted lipid-binding transport protein (Tim44 family)